MSSIVRIRTGKKFTAAPQLFSATGVAVTKGIHFSAQPHFGAAQESVTLWY
jgi:hypothetical protein